MGNKIIKGVGIILAVVAFFGLFLTKKECDTYLDKKTKSPEVCEAYLATRVASNPSKFSSNDLKLVFGRSQHDERTNTYFFNTGGHPMGFISLCVMEVSYDNGQVKTARSLCH